MVVKKVKLLILLLLTCSNNCYKILVKITIVVKNETAITTVAREWRRFIMLVEKRIVIEKEKEEELSELVEILKEMTGQEIRDLKIFAQGNKFAKVTMGKSA